MEKKKSFLIIIVCAVFALGVQLFVWFMAALTAEGMSAAEALHVIPFDLFAFAVTWAVLCLGVFAALFFKRWNDRTFFEQKITAAAEKNRKKILSAVGIILLVLFLFKINDSNMRGYRGILAGNFEQTYMFSIGTVRGVRSDEWQGLAINFHNDLEGDLKLLWAGAGSTLAKANNLLKMINPFHWGALYMHMEHTLSWDYLFATAVCFYGFFRLMQIITGSWKFGLFSAFVLVWSSQFQWWWGPRSTGYMACLVACFYDFFKTDRKWIKILICWALMCLCCEIVEGMYAWDVPAVYLYLLMLIGIYLNEKQINFKKTDIPYICVVLGLIGIIVLGYFFSGSGEYVGDFNTVIQTEYPGKRFDAGGNLGLSYLQNYILAPFLTWKEFTVPGTNISETSSFLSLFPLPLVLFFLKFRELKKNKVIWAVLLACVFCAAYCFVGFSDGAAALTLMSFSTPSRCADMLGFALLILLLLECHDIRPSAGKLFQDKKVAAGLAVTIMIMAAYYGHVIITRPDFNYFVGGKMMAYWVVLLLVMAGMLYLGMKKGIALLLCFLTVVSGVMVNPINSGCAIMNGTPIAKEIQKINGEDRGVWLTLHDDPLGKYVYAQGADCISYINWPPELDLYGSVDPDGEYFNVYNRYAHVVVELTDEETSFELNAPDKFTIHLNYRDLRKLDVKYIAVKEELAGREGVDFDEISLDPYDKIHIYRIDYA